MEKGFDENLKSSTAFVDLTAAYDTVLRQGLLSKLLKVIPCLKIYKIIKNALSNRPFRVLLGDKSSSYRVLNNGLPQGSVLAPTLFNLYTYDMPETHSRIFVYADDLALVAQDRNIATTENQLERDLGTVDEYFVRWRLCPSASKTEVCCFHLNTRHANRKLNISFRGSMLYHNPFPKYLGVTLDRSLTYSSHLKNVAAKLRPRINILQKLTGTTWGASASCLRTSALALVYSTAEYCAPTWINSTHTNTVDTQLNATMRVINSCMKPTPVHWLPALSNIAPPHLRRQHHLLREVDKAQKRPELPINKDLTTFTSKRLKSRNPPALLAHQPSSQRSINEAWTDEWSAADTLPEFHLTNHAVFGAC